MSDLSADLVFFSVLYVVLLLVIGAFARQAREEDSLSDFFLANRTLGFGVLLFTFLATQFSGNSFQGFPAQVYREGMSYFMGVTFTVGIIAGSLLFVPRLFSLARRHAFVTPTDYIWHRYQNPVLSYVSAGIYVIILCNFLLAQLIALGQAFSGLTGGQIPYWAVVVGGGIVVLAYQIIGGLRAVAWTDVFQGLLLIIGLLVIIALIWLEIGSPASVARSVQLLRPELMASPDWEICFIWLSNFLLLALGSPLYPQVIQRVYAARRVRELRRVLAGLAIIPLLTGTGVVFIGAAGIALFPQLDRIASDQVTFRVLSYLVESSALTYYPVLLVMMAVLAAIMSTADSCLLSVSSVFTKDIVARARGLTEEQAERLLPLAPWFSVGVMGVLMVLAMWPLTTLWGLLVIKFEILIQLSPAFVLGTLHDRDDPRAFAVSEILAGLVSGLVVTLALYLSGYQSLAGLHAGTVGVAVNYVLVLAWRAVRFRRSQAAEVEIRRQMAA